MMRWDETVLCKTVLRGYIRRVLKASDAWQALYDELRLAFTRTWSQEAADATAAALDRLRELGPGRFSEEDRTQLLNVFEQRLGPEAMRAALRGPVLNLSDALFRLGAQEVGTATGLDIAFGRPDLDALDQLAQGNLYWVGNSWNAETWDKVGGALDDYFRKGMTRQQLLERMAGDFAGLTERSQLYWNILADHTATRTREMGRVSGYERAGIEYVQVRAHLDARTSRVCRAMHGRIIPVERLSAQRAAYLSAMQDRDLVRAKQAWVMHGEADAEELTGQSTAKLQASTASPPYHLRCRTITVLYAPSSPPEEWAAATYNRTRLDRSQVAQLVEHCKAARWGSDAKLKDHHARHGRHLAGSLAGYSQLATDLIRRADRDVYLASRHGRLKALFVEPRPKGKATLCVVDVETQVIETCHVRPLQRLSAGIDEVQAIKQPGRGIAKWLFG